MFKRILSPKVVQLDLYSNRVVIRYKNDGEEVTKDLTATIPFSNARLLVAEFEVAEAFLKQAFKELNLVSLWGGSLRVIVTTKEKNEGGLSQVEWRAILELVERAGATSVQIDDIENPYLKT